jgi:hypothetical protein
MSLRQRSERKRAEGKEVSEENLGFPLFVIKRIISEHSEEK